VKIGLPVPNISQPVGAESIHRVAVKADESGFDSVWVGDHLVWPTDPAAQRPGETPARAKYGGDLYEPFCTAGYLSAITSRVQIGFGIIVAPYRHLAITTKMLTTLDQLSAGRIIAGVGPGYVQGEFDALGIPRRGTGDKVDDLIDFVRAVEESSTPAFDGRTFSFHDAIFRPRPFRGRMPIWIGGNSTAALRRAVRAADGWQPSNVDLRTMEGMIDSLHREAEDAARDLSDFTISGRIRARFDAKVTPYDPSLTGNREYSDLPAHLHGPPEYVAEQLSRYAELGVDHLVINLHEGDELEELLRAMDVFATSVRPLVEVGSPEETGEPAQ